MTLSQLLNHSGRWRLIFAAAVLLMSACLLIGCGDSGAEGGEPGEDADPPATVADAGPPAADAEPDAPVADAEAGLPVAVADLPEEPESSSGSQEAHIVDSSTGETCLIVTEGDAARGRSLIDYTCGKAPEGVDADPLVVVSAGEGPDRISVWAYHKTHGIAPVPTDEYLIGFSSAFGTKGSVLDMDLPADVGSVTLEYEGREGDGSDTRPLPIEG